MIIRVVSSRSLTDKAMVFETIDGGSIPPGSTRARSSMAEQVAMTRFLGR